MLSLKGRNVRELAYFSAFVALSVAMTWPWARGLRYTVSDTGDPYFMAWVLWTDFFRTFHAPLQLFNGNIFFPLRYSLAFSEHAYGVALPFFPLFALGAPPLTVVSIATLLAFPFSGYAAFRLARTLSGSTPAAFLTGIAFAFTPYRFSQLPHLVYIFSGWLPLAFEALVLFFRRPSRRRALWLGFSFLMHGLTCIHWLILGALPYALLSIWFLIRQKAARDRRLLRGVVALLGACLSLLPFLVPYQRAAALYGFTRSANETLHYSAEPRDWLRAASQSKLWHGLGAPAPEERDLFPGAAMPALAVVAALLPWWRSREQIDTLFCGAVLALLGFLGSLGMNFYFHRLLFELLPPFRSIRVPARWAMLGHLGLALLAGLGAAAIAARLRRSAGRVLLVVVGGLLLLDLRQAPLSTVRGAPDPDSLSRALADVTMNGGLVELPSNTGGRGNYEYVLRAADHRKPLVNGVSGFVPYHVRRLDALATARPIPDALLDHLESIPTSYLVVHESYYDPWDLLATRQFLERGLASGRLRFIRRFDGRRRDDLYAVTRTEPTVAGDARPPWTAGPETVPSTLALREDPRLLGSVDEPADAATIHGPLLVRGWARAPGEDLEVVILLDGEFRTPLSLVRAPRPDVCIAFPDLAPCESAGYEARFGFRDLDDGAHELAVLFRSRDGRARHYPIRRFQWRR